MICPSEILLLTRSLLVDGGQLRQKYSGCQSRMRIRMTDDAPEQTPNLGIND